jgi:hypothetical protein
MTNNNSTTKRLSDSDLEDLICELEAAGFYRRQLICLVELQELRKSSPITAAASDVLAERQRQMTTKRGRWPWDKVWWPSDRRRNLVKVGALILAEIERIDCLRSNGHE